MRVHGAPMPAVTIRTTPRLASWLDQQVLLVALAPLLYVYMPRPPISGAHLLAFPAVAAVLALAVLARLAVRPVLDRVAAFGLVLLIALGVATGISFLANAAELRGRAFVELFRPAIIGVFLLSGYYAAVPAEREQVRRGLLLAGCLILVGQLAIAITQVFGVPAFNLVYAADKSRRLGSLMRVTGSLGNPNSFAWIVTQATVVMFALSRTHRYVWPVLGGLLVLISGSRTQLMLLPAMLALIHVWSQARGWRGYARAGLLGAVALGVLLLVVFSFSAYFPYLAQLQNVFLSGSLSSVNSFAARVRNWSTIYSEFSRGGELAWILGIGSRELTAVVDNDYLFVLFRLGIVGVLTHLCVIGWAAWVFWSNWNKVAAPIGMEYLVFAMVAGLTSDTLAGWTYPLLLFYFVGLTLGAGRPQTTSPSNDVPAMAARAPRRRDSMFPHA